MKISANALVRIENDKIIEGYNVLDFLSLYAQLGLLPADAFDKGLSGQKIV